MSSPEILKEADRVMVICNSCRYCEGFCAVFPAMERRRTFTPHDLKYLANLCHNCRDCYYACQYAPPHQFDVNVPKTLGELRLDTYQDFTWPNVFKGLFRQNGLAVALITALCVLLVVLLTLFLKGPSAVFAIHSGENAFYRIIPYWVIVVPFSLLGFFIILSLLNGFLNFWQETTGRNKDLKNLRAYGRALIDVLQLKYLAGGGHGCNYPDERFSHIRRWFHHMTFYGFMLCFAATTIAAIYDHFLHWSAPYPFWSWPVVLGTLGGTALLVGTGGLMYLKFKMDAAPAVPRAYAMDLGFLALLLLTSLSGLLLLIFRETPAMGILLAVHVGIVLGLFITMPYGKFVHSIYRFAALLRNAIEACDEQRSIAPQDADAEIENGDG